MISLKQNYSVIKKLTILFICTLLISVSASQMCGLGCLQCDEINDKCLLCDSSSFFYFDYENGLCSKTLIENCSFAISKDQCLLCNNNFTPSDTGDCVQNTSDSTQCELSYATNKCAKCKDNFYVNPNTAQCIENTDLEENISECILYNKGGCAQCSNGFMFDKSTKTCKGKII